MLDILDDSCSGLEIDRIKDKIRDIWTAVITAEYNEQYSNQKEDSDDYVSMDDYIKEHQLYFPGDDKPENEVDGIVEMLENMFDDKEELDPVSKEGKAPSYSGSQLKANNEKGKVEATSYEVKHTMTSTPKDSQSSAKSNTYEHHTGKIAPRKDSQVKRSYSPMVQKIVEELLELDNRQGIGRRKMLFRL
jgi:hypothetical protein